MTRLRALLSRVGALFRSRQLDQDLRDQIHAHLDEAIDDYVRQGLSPAEARRAALIDFGGVARAEEAVRDARGPWLRDLTKDVHYGLRTLRRNPGFATVAFLSLAVGIGANAAIFSVMNALLLRPRPVADPGRLVELYTGTRSQPYEATSYPSYVDLRDRNGVFTGLAGYGIRQFRLGDANEVEQVWGEVVTGNYFDVLGVPPYQGRAFAADEDRAPGRNPVVVIGHGLWQRRFNSNPNFVGQTITINGEKLTVIGIAPPHYTGSIRGLASEVWVPVIMLPVLEPWRGQAALTRRSRWLTLLGRLKPDTSIEQARARFDLLSREMQAAYPEEWRSKQSETDAVRELFVTVLEEREARIHPDMQLGAYAIAALCFAIVNLVLVIACMNLAGMLLARAIARRREMAIRLALGAGRWRIVRQLTTESLLLSMIAGIAGIVLGAWLIGVLLAFLPTLPEGIRLALDLRLDWRVLVYTIAFSTVTGLLFGLAPAFQGARTDVSGVLKDDSSASTGGYRTSRSRSLLVVAQVACSLLLLVAAGLVLRSLEKVRPTRLGFTSDNVLVASLNLDEAQYDRSKSQEFYRLLADRVSALPAVKNVTLVQGMPGGFMSRTRRGTEIEGYQPAAGETLEIDASIVGPRYFSNMKIPIVQGRDFDERDRDGAPCVAVVNEAFVRRYFPGAASPLGKHLAKFESGPTKTQCEIVGLVRDGHWQSLRKAPVPFYWLALHQMARMRMTLLVNTEGDPAAQIAGVRRTVLRLDPKMPVEDVQTLRGYFSAMLYPFRLLALVMGVSGMMALLLASIGIYGTVSYSVAQRTREMGIRMALGALKSDILKKVVYEGMAVVAWGLVLGLLLSVALTGVLTSSFIGTGLLFGVSATDSMTFAGVTFILSLVALVACYIPALRATKIPPIEALRYE